MNNSEKTMDKIVALCKNRGFVYPGSEIYGGLANTWDYGPLSVELTTIFIFGLEMDIAGAAVATVIAQMSSCIFVLYTLKRKKMRIPLTLVKPEREIGKRIVKIGFSPFLILASDSVIIIALNAVLQYYGGADYGDTLITAATIVPPRFRQRFYFLKDEG